jgi:hypothetical protein
MKSKNQQIEIDLGHLVECAVDVLLMLEYGSFIQYKRKRIDIRDVPKRRYSKRYPPHQEPLSNCVFSDYL